MTIEEVKAGRSRRVDPENHRSRRPSQRSFRCEITIDDFASDDPLGRIFARQAPREIEIGCGKGRFIIRCAESMPDVDFIAVERASRYFRIAATRTDRRNLKNLKLIRTDGTELMGHLIPEASVRAVHVLFPDPWPKKRHHKRRLLCRPFLESVERVVPEGGTLNVVTDHVDYYAAITALMKSRSDRWAAVAFSLAERLPVGEVGLTNYEVKYRETGRGIHQASWERRP